MLHPCSQIIMLCKNNRQRKEYHRSPHMLFQKWPACTVQKISNHLPEEEEGKSIKKKPEGIFLRVYLLSFLYWQDKIIII